MSQFNAPSYDVSRTTGTCALTGKTLEPDEIYFATLVETGELFERVDVCLEVWEQGKRPENMFSYWKTVVPQPNEKKKMFVDDEVLLNLLRRLADAKEPIRVAFRFVLMLILMRKKMLRYDRTKKELLNNDAGEQVEQDWWVLTPKLNPHKGPMSKWHDSETFEVLDPHLDEQGIREMTEQLGQILHAEL